jgi:hypothetical protein
LFTGDVLIYPGDLPIYEDVTACLGSIRKLRRIVTVENLFSSWEAPIQGHDNIIKRIDGSIAYLERIHAAVINNSRINKGQTVAQLCQSVIKELGLPPFADMPLVAKALASSMSAE